MTIALFDCRACVERASDYLNGDLPGWSRLVTAVHVRICRDCRVHAEQLRTTVRVLRTQGEGGEHLGEETRRALLEKLGS